MKPAQTQYLSCIEALVRQVITLSLYRNYERRFNRMKLDSKLIADRIVIRNYEIEDKEFCTGMWFDKENGKYLSDPIDNWKHVILIQTG